MINLNDVQITKSQDLWFEVQINHKSIFMTKINNKYRANIYIHEALELRFDDEKDIQFQIKDLNTPKVALGSSTILLSDAVRLANNVQDTILFSEKFHQVGLVNY